MCKLERDFRTSTKGAGTLPSLSLSRRRLLPCLLFFMLNLDAQTWNVLRPGKLSLLVTVLGYPILTPGMNQSNADAVVPFY